MGGEANVKRSRRASKYREMTAQRTRPHSDDLTVLDKKRETNQGLNLIIRGLTNDPHSHEILRRRAFQGWKQ